MANPSTYAVSYDFSNAQAVNPAAPLSGVALDTELGNIETALASVRAAVLDIRRSDGALKNGIVTLDSLAAPVRAAIGGDVLAYVERAETAKTGAETAEANAETAQAAAETAQAAAVSAKTAAEAARDAAQALAGANAAEIVFTPSGGISSLTVADALLELDTEKSAVGHGHAATEITTSVSGITGSTVQAILDALGVARLRTGDYVLSVSRAARPGWVLCDDGTIGSAASVATTRANADCEALFKLIWSEVTNNAYAPVSGGRGVSADADWSANKTIGLTKVLGRALAVAGAGSGLTSRALGLTIGAESMALVNANLPPYTPSGSVTTTVTSRNYLFSPLSVGVDTGGFGIIAAQNYGGIDETSTFSGNPQGGISQAFSLMQPTTFACNVYLKL